MRVAELQALDLADVDLVGEQVKVRGKGRKERIVPLGGAAVRALRRCELRRAELRAAPVDQRAVFISERGRRLSARQVQSIVRRFLDRIAEGAGLSTHSIRHSFATHLLDAGADINQVTAGDHTSPLLIAVINGNYDLALELLKRGADPNLASEDGAAPLFATINCEWALRTWYPQPTAYQQQQTTHLELMDALLKAGANPNARVETHIWYAAYNAGRMGVDYSGATAFWRAAYALDVPAMRLLVQYGADPNIPTVKPPEGRGPGAVNRRDSTETEEKKDPSGLPPVPVGGPGVHPLIAASGVGHGTSRVGQQHRHVPDGWLPAVKYLVDELKVDVNVRDHDGYNAVHNAAARGDNEMIEYLVSKGADVMAVSRRGQSTVDMANGPQQRVQPFPETIKLLEGLGAKNNHKCQSCE